MQKTAALMGQDFFLEDQMQDRHIKAALGGNGEASAASVQPAAALNVTVGDVPWPWEGTSQQMLLLFLRFHCESPAFRSAQFLKLQSVCRRAH